MRYVRTLLGSVLLVLGILLTIIPGSSLLLLAGLMLISVDYKPARRFLSAIQKSMSVASRKLDNALWRRKFR